ncbi:MAG: hypothetical protein KDD64_17260, partial [Bdellovibrionales bacterium]|nr:hypothetical protein [Bdellovibrionales bacterium]
MHFKDSLLALLPVSLLLPLYRWRNRMAHLTDGELLLQIGQMFLRGKNIAGAGSCFQLLLQGEWLIEAFLLGLLLKNSPEGRFVLKRSPVEDSSLVELQLLPLLSLKKGSPKRRGELSR